MEPIPPAAAPGDTAVTSPSSTSPPSEATSAASGNDDSSLAGHGKEENGGYEKEMAVSRSSKLPGEDGSKERSDSAVNAAPSKPLEGNGSAVCDTSGSIVRGSEGAKKVRISAQEEDNQEKTSNDSLSVVASRGRQKNNNSPLSWAGTMTGVGGNGGRFMQRDIDAAKLMIRARRLDFAAREWVGVRGLLLRRATTAAAESKKLAKSEVNGGGSKELVQTGRALFGEDRAGVGGAAKMESVSGGGIGADGCSKILVLQPTVSYKRGGKVDRGDVGLAPMVELESALEALAIKGDIVQEKPGEDMDGLGVGWGGWDSGANEQVTLTFIDNCFINIFESWKANNRYFLPVTFYARDSLDR